MDVSPVKKEKSKKKSKKDLGEIQAESTFRVEPSEKPAPALDTSNWPLLLKNFDKLNVRTNHYTPLPFGSSPLTRGRGLDKKGFSKLKKPDILVHWIPKLLDA